MPEVMTIYMILRTGQDARRYNCMDAGGRATQESKPRTPKVGALGDAGAIIEARRRIKIRLKNGLINQSLP